MTATPLCRVACERSADTLFVTVEGELDLAVEEEVVRAARAAWTATRSELSRVVVDTSGVSFVDSSGLRALLRCRDAASEQGFEFVLRAAPDSPVQRLIALAGVGEWFAYA